MDYSSRFLSTILLLSASACGGVATTSAGGDGDGDGDDRPPSRGFGDGDDEPPPVGDDGDGDGDGDGDDDDEPPHPTVVSGDGDGDGMISGVGGTMPSLPDYSPEAEFIKGGYGMEGAWGGYLFTAAEAQSTISPSEITGSTACVSGLLAAGYEQWAMVGWNIAQELDPDTFVGLTPNAISPGGSGIEVQVRNNSGAGLRVVLHSDEAATESWCAPVPPAGGVIPWSDFRKDCWTTGGETYDGVTPIAVVGVLTFGGSDTMPTAFDYCLLHLGPAL